MISIQREWTLAQHRMASSARTTSGFRLFVRACSERLGLPCRPSPSALRSCEIQKGGSKLAIRAGGQSKLLRPERPLSMFFRWRKGASGPFTLTTRRIRLGVSRDPYAAVDGTVQIPSLLTSPFSRTRRASVRELKISVLATKGSHPESAEAGTGSAGRRGSG